MILELKSHVNLISLDDQVGPNGEQKSVGLVAVNKPAVKSSMRWLFPIAHRIDASLKGFRNKLNCPRVAHIYAAVKLVGIVMTAVLYAGFHFVDSNVAFAIEQPCDIGNPVSFKHMLILHDTMSKSQQHTSDDAHLANSVNPLTGRAEGNTELTPFGVSVTTVHEGRKARASLDSYESTRGTRNECPPVRVIKVTDCNKDKMNQCAKDAAEQQAIYVDTEALSELYPYAAAANCGATAGRKSGLYNIGVTGSPIPLTETNILRYILMAQAVGDEQNWPKDNRWMVLPTWAAFLLNNSDIKDASLTGSGPSLLVNGHRIGKIGNFQLFESNLYTPITDGAWSCYPILFGHKSAISFASQLNDVEYFDKLESTVGKGMRGIQLYDWKVTKEESMGYVYSRMG